MQFTVTINQAKALEWGLNAQQALLFAFVYECPSWANKTATDDGDFFTLSKAKVIEELPLLTDKPDTVYRLLKQLAATGVIELSSTSSITLVRLTKKGQEWNKKLDGTSKYKVGKKSDLGEISEHGKKSDLGRKKIRAKVGKKSDTGSEKSPTNQVTSNQVTSNQVTNQYCDPVPAEPPQGRELVLAVDNLSDKPKAAIPEDMPGPKDQTCKTFKAWANYAVAYRKRYGIWPVWNRKTGGQFAQLVERLGANIAHHVAAYYLTINDSKLINACHSVNLLLAGAESYHTQWATNTQMNATTARQLEQTQANANAARQAAANIREKGKSNAYLRTGR